MTKLHEDHQVWDHKKIPEAHNWATIAGQKFLVHCHKSKIRPWIIKRMQAKHVFSFKQVWQELILPPGVAIK